MPYPVPCLFLSSYVTRLFTFTATNRVDTGGVDNTNCYRIITYGSAYPSSKNGSKKPLLYPDSPPLLSVYYCSKLAVSPITLALPSLGPQTHTIRKMFECKRCLAAHVLSVDV